MQLVHVNDLFKASGLMVESHIAGAITLHYACFQLVEISDSIGSILSFTDDTQQN